MRVQRLIISALSSGLRRPISSGTKSAGSLPRAGGETTNAQTWMAVRFALKGFEEPAGSLRAGEMAFRLQAILPSVPLAENARCSPE